MYSSRWATVEELKRRLVKLSSEEEITKSGLPMMYDDDSVYVDTSENHVIVVGATGSGKTQTTLLPESRLAIRAGESIVINDVKGEIYDRLKNDLEKNDYNVIKINLSNPEQSNNYNIFSLPYDLYKNNEKDKAVEVLENTIRYLIMDQNLNPNVDPFWENTATNYLVGVVLYLFETSNEVPTIKDAYKLAMEFDKEIINTLDKTSAIYVNLAPTVLAPPETKGSIISVLAQKVRTIISREQLTKVLETSDFDLKDIPNKKTALFIISGDTNYISSIIVPMIVTQIYYATSYFGTKERRLSVFIDEFEKLLPIRNFEVMADYSRTMNIKYLIFIKSLLELKNKYGREEAELIKLSFGTIVYLLANDIETLEDISNLCGNVKTPNDSYPLITKEELKLLNPFEAVVLIPRMYPIRTKFLPDYKYPWNN